MQKICWSKELEVGVEEIDAQHRRLVDTVNSLADAMRQPNPDDKVESLLDEMVEYVTHHFHQEERLMRDMGYPGLAKHQIAHAGFVKQTLIFLHQYHTAEFELSILQGFLSGWLVGHIMGPHDQQLGRYLVASGAGRKVNAAAS